MSCMYEWDQTTWGMIIYSSVGDNPSAWGKNMINIIKYLFDTFRSVVSALGSMLALFWWWKRVETSIPQRNSKNSLVYWALKMSIFTYLHLLVSKYKSLTLEPNHKSLNP